MKHERRGAEGRAPAIICDATTMCDVYKLFNMYSIRIAHGGMSSARRGCKGAWRSCGNWPDGPMVAHDLTRGAE
eukprot:scaffold29833_cov128-Isochrysis_galbana.AAC.3